MICYAQDEIPSGKTRNTEKEQAFFTGIKTNTKLTSNCHPENLVTNSIVHAQTRESF